MMRNRLQYSAIALMAFAALCIPAPAEEQDKKLKAASLDGTTGLFKVWDAETLRRNEFNLVVGFDHYNRDPGELVIKKVPAGGAFGVTDRFEVFATIDVSKRVTAGNIKVYRVLPGQLPRPAATPYSNSYFSNEAPFIDVPRAAGLGDVHLGAKYNILSESRGKPIGFSMAGFLKSPTNDDATYLNRGLGTGAVEAGFAGLVSKRAGKIAQLHVNFGANFAKDPRMSNNMLANLQHSLVYRGGAAFPTYGRIQLIGELVGRTYFGSRTDLANPRSPLDVIVGVRGYLNRMVSGSIGYQATLHRIKAEPNINKYASGTTGMVAELAIGRRRNDPPSVACAISNPSIKQDDKTTIRANATDPDGDQLTYAWSSSGGKLTGAGDTATFDATGIAPGKYTVTATVSDGKHQASCSSEITVIKRNLPPTVSCQPSAASLTVGESTTIRATASDPNSDPLAYSWTVNGQKLAADGPAIAFGTSGRRAGQYVIAVTVSDGELSASCSSTVTVKEPVKINQPPRIECLTSTLDVVSGSSIELRSRASDPDNDRLSFTWSATAGTASGSGETATYNSTGVKAGTVTVTAGVDDGRGGKASCNMTVNVSELIRISCSGKVEGGGFAPKGARVDNCAKAMLDDLALRMKSDSHLFANVIGYTDGSKLEASVKGLGEKRAKAVIDYLTKKGADPDRLKATDGGSANPVGDAKTEAGRKQNRRVEIELTVR